MHNGKNIYREGAKNAQDVKIKGFMLFQDLLRFSLRPLRLNGSKVLVPDDQAYEDISSWCQYFSASLRICGETSKYYSTNVPVNSIKNLANPR